MNHNIKIGDREYTIQEAYEWPLAIYLFLGGISGALITISVILYFMGISNLIVLLSSVSAIIFMGLAGIVLLLFELMRPFAAWRSLTKWKHSGISWDVILVSLVIGSGILFTLPLINDWINLGGFNNFLRNIQPITGILSLAAGILFPIISGGLLSAFNSVPLWHGPGLPVLMFLTSFNAAFSYLVLISSTISEIMLKTFWGIIFTLTVLTVLTVLAYIEAVKNGPVEAKLGMNILKQKMIFILGFIVIGLIVPIIISGWMFFGAYMPIIALIGAISTLIGGFILRHYMLKAGVHTYPWPY